MGVSLSLEPGMPPFSSHILLPIGVRWGPGGGRGVWGLLLPPALLYVTSKSKVVLCCNLPHLLSDGKVLASVLPNQWGCRGGGCCPVYWVRGFP